MLLPYTNFEIGNGNKFDVKFIRLHILDPDVDINLGQKVKKKSKRRVIDNYLFLQVHKP